MRKYTLIESLLLSYIFIISGAFIFFNVDLSDPGISIQ